MENKFEEGKIYIYDLNDDIGKIQYRIRIVKKTEKTIKFAISHKFLEIYGAFSDNVEDQPFSEEEIYSAKIKIYKNEECFKYSREKIVIIRHLAKEIELN